MSRADARACAAIRAVLAAGMPRGVRELPVHLGAKDGGQPVWRLGGRHREWYPLTYGPVIDLDALPPARRSMRLPTGCCGWAAASRWNRARAVIPGPSGGRWITSARLRVRLPRGRARLVAGAGYPPARRQRYAVVRAADERGATTAAGRSGRASAFIIKAPPGPGHDDAATIAPWAPRPADMFARRDRDRRPGPAPGRPPGGRGACARTGLRGGGAACGPILCSEAQGTPLRPGGGAGHLSGAAGASPGPGPRAVPPPAATGTGCGRPGRPDGM